MWFGSRRLTYFAISSIHACRRAPHPRHRGSLMSSHAKIVGSSRYETPVNALTRSMSAFAFALYMRPQSGSEKNADFEASKTSGNAPPPRRRAAAQSRYWLTPPWCSQ